MSTKLRLVFAITIAFLSFYGTAQEDCWKQEVSQNGLSTTFATQFKVKKGLQFSFDEQGFKKQLTAVLSGKQGSRIVYFPNAKGERIAFQVHEASVLSPELSRKFPNIKSFAGYALNDRKTKIRFSISHKGLQSMMVHADQEGATFMQKEKGDKYILYTRDSSAKKDANFICSTQSALEHSGTGLTQKIVDDQVLRTFRLAVTASGEYTEYHGGSVADALAAINATVTRINEVFETDLGVSLELVSGLEDVIFTDPLTDPYSGSLSPRVQATLDDTLGAANYDFGILFNQAAQGDGNAGFIGAVCVDNRKGSAYASGPVPEGDIFDLDFVAHEMGHQFGANHTWSFEPEGTQTQVEPASGTTIMGYAGITGPNDVASNGDDYFHYASIVQITDYLNTVGCGQTMSLTNTPPVVTPTGNFTIPKSTPFVLTGVASDSDAADVLTFAWEQIDNGIVPTSSFGPTNPTGANFRSQKPSTNPSRYFPKLAQVLQGELTQTAPALGAAWETVSDVERELNFALTVRDNAIGGGQVVSDLVNVFVENSAGPFEVTSQSTATVAVAGSVQTITWNVANTNMPPVNAQTVDILLSTDGGLTFTEVLAENVTNDGSHEVVMPGSATTEARIMVKANGNIFFAVNAADFSIDEAEIVLNFEALEQEVCQSDVLVVPFNYEAYGGFNEEATFSISAPPAGVDIAIFPETATDTDTPVDISFTNTANLAAGSYPINLVATTASQTKEITFNLNVYDTQFTPLNLLSPADELVDTSTNILLEWEADFLATSYDVEIATDAAFTSIIESASVLTNAYLPQSLAYETQYFWRVKPKNNCGEGAFNIPFGFTTIQFSCVNRSGAGLPLTISTVGTPTVVSEISVFDDMPVADINVNLELDHSYLSDLTITLTSPAGTSVVLLSNSCEEFSNINATFDDSAAAFVCNGNPAIQGVVKPQGSLSAFEGESSLGVWVLSVADNAPADGGQLKSVTLDICVEGEFRPDADEDGVFDDGPDLCLGTPAGATVDASGCEVLLFSQTNFTIEAKSESCRNNNDGAIAVEVKTMLDYAITVTGNGFNSTDTFSTATYELNDLSAGTYTLCLNASEGGIAYREQCFEVVVEEPELLSVSSKVAAAGDRVDLEMQGAALYTVSLNGEVIQTEASQISLDLKEGSNVLKVSTNLPCQGSYEEELFFSKEPRVYPNPFTDVVNLAFGRSVSEVAVRIFSASGRLIRTEVHSVNTGELTLDVSALAAGLYFVQFEAELEAVKGTSKIIKK